MTIDELTRLAFIYGEQDRRTMAEADPGEAGQKAAQLADKIIKRWGKTQFEADIENATTITVGELLRRRDPLRCEECGRELTEETAVWLEKNAISGEWGVPGMESWSGGRDSQGSFSFGKDCAEKKVKGSSRATYIKVF